MSSKTIICLPTRPLRFAVHSSWNLLPCEAPMAFTIRPSRRFPVQCTVTYNAGPF